VTRQKVAALLVAGALTVGARSASAGIGLDPFRPDGTRAARATLDPIRVAEAATPAAVPAPKAAPKVCESDADCPDETICEERICQRIQTSTNILYLYYRDGAFREIAGLYWSKRGASGYTFLAPIYWHTWSPKGRSHIIAPLFWRFENYVTRNVVTVVPPLLARSSGPDGAFTWVAPLNFFWSSKDDSSQLVLPLYYANGHKDGGTFATWLGYASWDKDSRSGAALWLYWWGSDRKAKSGYHILFPLVWDFKDGDDRSTVVFPLVWSYSGADSNTTLAVNFLHLRRGASTFDTLFPLWWSGSDDKAGTAFKMLLPLVYWQSGAHGRNSLWVTPLGGWSRDDDARSRTLTLLPLLSFWRHDPSRQLRVFTPLFIHHHSYTDDSTTGLYAGVVYTRDDPQGTTRALLPLLWRFHDADTGATATALLPLFARRDGPRDTTTAVGVLPFVWAYWRDFKNGGWGAGIFPFAFFGQNAGRSHAVVAPLFWHWAGASDTTTVVAPLFYWHRDEHGHAGGAPPVLTFWGAHDGDSYAIQFPLYWHFASERLGTSTTATPVGYFHRDRDGWSLGVGPVVPLFYARSGVERSHAVLFPIFWHFRDATEQRTTTVLGPFWHRTVGGESTTALFPVFYYRHGARPGGDDEASLLLPFLYYTRDAQRRVLVTPLGVSARGPNRAAGFIGPYFWYKDDDLDASFIPLLHADVSRRATGERTRQWGLVFALDGPGHKSRVVFPLFGHYEDAGETDTYVFPSYFRQRRTDGSRVDAFIPLYWRSVGADRQTTVVALWYDHTAPNNVHDTGLVPFWFHARDAERSLTAIPLLLFVRRHDWKSDEERLWFALLWHARDHAGSSTTVFPLWWSASAAGKSHQVVFPLFWRFADDTAKSSWALAGPFYWSAHGTERTRGVLPVVWHTSNPADGSGATGLMPLFYEAHGPQRGTFMTALAGWHHSPTSRWAYAGPLVPLWISHTDVVRDGHTTIVTPLLLYTRRDPESSVTTIAGVFWHHHDVTSSTTLALPLVWDFHEFDVSRTTVVFPLFYRHANEIAGTSTAIAPLFLSHASPEGSTTVGFPLYWDFQGKDTRTTILFPLFAHWRRPGYASTWVFPTIYHSKGLSPSGQPDGTWHTVVAPFYAAAVKRPGDFMWELLGGLVGHETVGRNRYLKLLFMRFEQEPAPRAQTAWYSQPARAPRRQASRGLSMNNW
jgi:hypothetical protein